VPKKPALHNQRKNQNFAEYKFISGESQKRGDIKKIVMSVTTVLRLINRDGHKKDG
jgi:hypothetical protein